MKTAVIIVTYNRIELLKECLACALNQTRPFSHIIVVNNASTDGTTEYLNGVSKEQESLVVLNQEENLGGAGGFYKGFEYANAADYDWVLVIDDDAMIEPDYNEKLTDYGEDHPEVNALAGSVWTDNRMDFSHRRQLKSRLLLVEIPVKSDGIKDFQCECATFCGLMIRGSVMRECGLPKREYFIWYDDSEYCLRLLPYGAIRVLPQVRLNHRTVLAEEKAGVLARTNWRMYYGYRNRLDTARVRFGFLSGLGVATEYAAFLVITAFELLVPSKREHARFNMHMISDALYDGWHARLGFNEKYHR